jgi:TatD DNase family protein
VRLQCAAHPQLRATVGISPFEAGSLPDGWLEQLRESIADPAVIAIGEAGLDQTNPAYPPAAQQRPLLEAQMALAVEHDLPLVVHSRGAEREVAELCRDNDVRRVLFHCFTGDAAALELLLECGYYVSFSGIVTFARNPVAAVAARAPLDRVLVETDTPYLAPVPHRGRPNQPAWVVHVAQALAKLHDMAPGDFARALARNFETLFGHSGRS